MNTARFRMSVRRMMVILAVGAVGFSLALGSRTTYHSCCLCRNRKHVQSHLMLGFAVSWHETMETNYPTAPGHRHVWWNYARVVNSLLLGSGAASSDHRYVDGGAAPDGRP
jgi:hypothetical protein